MYDSNGEDTLSFKGRLKITLMTIVGLGLFALLIRGMLFLVEESPKFFQKHASLSHTLRVLVEYFVLAVVVLSVIWLSIVGVFLVVAFFEWLFVGQARFSFKVLQWLVKPLEMLDNKINN